MWILQSITLGSMPISSGEVPQITWWGLETQKNHDLVSVFSVTLL